MQWAVSDAKLHPYSVSQRLPQSQEMQAGYSGNIHERNLALTELHS